MEISAMKPEERVFRIDDECYIIYLGSERDDHKPFLRIGNSERITPDIVSGTHNIVITDSLTGNPALEPKNMNREDTRENRYVGDRKITASLMKFIQQFNIEDGMVSTIEDVHKAHKRAEVHFFDDGNIQVLYDRDMLFDLRKREQTDLHFIERSRMLKEIHSKNPLRYRPGDLERPGFTIIGGNAVIFDRGRLTSFGIATAFFKDFVNAGIDPDLIDTVVTDNIGGSFFRLLKRKWNTKGSIRILTGNPPLVKGAAGLFTESRAGKLDADIVSFKPEEKRTVSGFRLEREKRGIVVKHRDIPWPLLISSRSTREPGYFKLNPERAVIVSPGKASAGGVPIPQGVVHIFCSTVPERRELVRNYFRDLYSIMDDLLSPQESMAAKLIDQVLDGLGENSAPKPVLERIRKSLKSLKLGEGSALFYLLNNVHGIITMLAASRKEGNGNIASFLPLSEAAHKKIATLDRANLYLPVTGDVFITGEGAVVLYRPVRGATSRDAFALNLDLVQDVEKRAAAFIQDLDREYVRLRTFMAELRGEPAGKMKRLLKKGAVAVTGVAGTEGAALPKVSVAVSRKKREGVLAAEKEAATTEERQAYTTAPVQRVSYTKGLSGPLRFIIPAAVVVVAAIVLVLFFLFPDVIRRGGAVEREAKMAALREGTEQVEQGVQGEEAAGEGEKAFKPDEFLEEKGIPQSALTDRRTVIYRGLIEITVLDIYLLTNEIAVSNGYRRLDSVDEVGRDPDWIYPGNLFTLPDKTEYTVVKGDTMWYIAHRFIIKRLEEDWDRFSTLKREVDIGSVDTQRKEVLEKNLKYLRERSYSENFNREIDKTIGKLENMV